MRSDLCRLNNLSKPPQNEIRVLESKTEIISNRVKKILMMETLRKELNSSETEYDTNSYIKEENKLYSLGFQHTKKKQNIFSMCYFITKYYFIE
jgi:hypothetical protein